MLCNYLQNVAAITYIFVLQLSTFLFYNKHATKKDHIEEIPQSSGFLAIKVNDNQLKTAEKE